MADISKITIESGTYNIKDEVAREHIKYYTPEEFGAVGDGITDDISALQDMFDTIEETLPTEPSDYQNKDWSGVRIIFSQKYAISTPLLITNSYGLVLDKCNLIATNNFVGDYLLGFDGGTREITIENSILNGNLRANKCIFVDDYTLVFRVVNSQITRFAQYGIYLNDDQGHEVMINKCKINQVEWAERNSLSTLVASGTGVYFGTNRHDSYMSNTVINYCRDYSLYINGGGANFITDCHFYWTDIVNKGNRNFFTKCYFDGTQLLTQGFVNIDGCKFGSDDGNAFIKFIDTYAYRWRYDYSSITNCVFENAGPHDSITDSVIFDETWEGHEDEFRIECIGNIFYDCPNFLYRTIDYYVPEQWKRNIWTGNQQFGNDGSCRIGDLLIQYGKVTASGYVNFPIEYAIKPFIVSIDKHGAGSQPMANDVSATRFYANNVDTECEWFAIGRMGA